ncbi:hypothetical protein GF406_26090 [candidate division KSB1 bacterium]|nr:hypothetical protein [candidate division KSB1 bacterium]
MKKNHDICVYFFLLVPVLASSQTVLFSGQASGWAQPGETSQQIGIRYIPALRTESALAGPWALDGLVSVNGHGGYRNTESARESTAELDAYRLWARLTHPRFEFRLGLQKLNFGAAMMLRPLMWFDRLDVRDPLQLTNGVNAAMSRWFFYDNANLWLWLVLGKSDRKGWEAVGSKDNSVEWGGRLQVPVPRGELALSGHVRQLDEDAARTLYGVPFDREVRLGLDGRWDWLAGWWIESSVSRFSGPHLFYRQFYMAGGDYTFAWGNGLHIIAEHLVLAHSLCDLKIENTAHFTAFSMDYPLGFLDHVTGYVYYDWENRDWYRLLQWQRTYDRWSFFVQGFANPHEAVVLTQRDEQLPMRGLGVQLMVVLNH